MPNNQVAYAVDGFHYCSNCFEQLFNDGRDWPVDEITPSDFEGEFVECEECGADVFYRATEISVINEQ